jgi:LPS export ABC transporter protein LptC
MRTRRLRAALLVVVVVALAGIGYQVWSAVDARRVPAAEKLAAELLPHVAQHIRNFRRVKVKDGRTVWEITADEAQYRKEEEQIFVVQPRVTFYLEGNERQARLRGSSGKIILTDGRELVSVVLDGDVVVQLDDLELRTTLASYEHATDRITAPGDVAIKGRRLDLRARGMEVDVTPQNMRLLDDVHTVLAPQGDAS